MGRRKENDPVGDAIRNLRGAIDLLYMAALRPVSDKPKQQRREIAERYAGIREAYGYSVSDGFRWRATGLLGAFQESTTPKKPGQTASSMLTALVGEIPDDLKFPWGGKDYAEYQFQTGDHYANGKPILKQGLQDLAHLWRDSVSLPQCRVFADTFLEPARWAALRFVSWANDAVERMETTYRPRGTWTLRRGGKSSNDRITIYTELAGVRRPPVSLQADRSFGKPGHLLYNLLAHGHGVCDADAKHDLCKAVPELAPFIDSDGAAKQDASGKGTKKTRYILNAEIRKRFVKASRKAKKSDAT